MANLFISNGQLIKPQNETNNPYIAEAPNIRYTKSNNSITSVKAAIDELVGLISQTPTLSSIEWYYGSAPQQISSGSTGTLYTGVVMATYNNGWCKDVTNGANFIPLNGSSTSGAGSISGTTITAPIVTSDRTITIKVQYTDNGITKEAEKVYGNRTISYVAKSNSQTTYYWYVGQTNPSTMSSIIGTADYNNGGGWTSTGNSVPETINQLVKGFDNTKDIFVAVPITSGTTLKPVASDMTTIDTSVHEVTTKTLNGVNYQIYIYDAGVTRTTVLFAKK